LFWAHSLIQHRSSPKISPTLPSSLPATCRSNTNAVTMHGRRVSTLPPCSCLPIHIVEHQSTLTCLPLTLVLPSVLPIAFLALAQLAQSASAMATTGPSSLPLPHTPPAILVLLPRSSPPPPSYRSQCSALPRLEQPPLPPKLPPTACARHCMRSGCAWPSWARPWPVLGKCGPLALQCHCSPPGSHPTGWPQPPLLSIRRR
jgi:hypothetical protein